MEPEQQLRNLRDFLLVYNRMTEICFQRCSSNFNYRNLTMDEERCVDNCAGKLIRSNHRLMGTYVQLMPQMVQRRMEEMESKAKEAEAAAAAAAAAASSQGSPAVEAPTASQVPDSSSPTPEVPAPLPPVLTDVGPDILGFSPPVGLDAAVPRSTAEAEVSFTAAAPFTPAAETPSPPVHVESVQPPVLSEAAAPLVIPVIPPVLKEAAAPSLLSEAAVLPVLSEPAKPPVLSEAVNLPAFSDTISGSSHTDMIPQLPTAAVHTESVSPAPVSMPLKPTSLSEDVPVSTLSAPAVSVQQRAPEAPPPPSSQ